MTKDKKNNKHASVDTNLVRKRFPRVRFPHACYEALTLTARILENDDDAFKAGWGVGDVLNDIPKADSFGIFLCRVPSVFPFPTGLYASRSLEGNGTVPHDIEYRVVPMSSEPSSRFAYPAIMRHSTMMRGMETAASMFGNHDDAAASSGRDGFRLLEERLRNSHISVVDALDMAIMPHEFLCLDSTTALHTRYLLEGELRDMLCRSGVSVMCADVPDDCVVYSIRERDGITSDLAGLAAWLRKDTVHLAVAVKDYRLVQSPDIIWRMLENMIRKTRCTRSVHTMRVYSQNLPPVDRMLASHGLETVTFVPETLEEGIERVSEKLGKEGGSHSREVMREYTRRNSLRPKTPSMYGCMFLSCIPSACETTRLGFSHKASPSDRVAEYRSKYDVREWLSVCLPDIHAYLLRRCPSYLIEQQCMALSGLRPCIITADGDIEQDMRMECRQGSIPWDSMCL